MAEILSYFHYFVTIFLKLPFFHASTFRGISFLQRVHFIGFLGHSLLVPLTISSPTLCIHQQLLL
jgi:hypothetical protein